MNRSRSSKPSVDGSNVTVTKSASKSPKLAENGAIVLVKPMLCAMEIKIGALFSSPVTAGRPISAKSSTPDTETPSPLVPSSLNCVEVTVLNPSRRAWLNHAATVSVTLLAIKEPSESKMLILSSASGVTEPASDAPDVKENVPGVDA